MKKENMKLHQIVLFSALLLASAQSHAQVIPPVMAVHPAPKVQPQLTSPDPIPTLSENEQAIVKGQQKLVTQATQAHGVGVAVPTLEQVSRLQMTLATMMARLRLTHHIPNNWNFNQTTLIFAAPTK
jgi:hypothetical protein